MKTIDTNKYPNLGNRGFQVADITDNATLQTLIDSVIYAYKNVFNYSAWGEGVKCSNGCSYKSTFENKADVCPDCGGEIIDYYSEIEVKQEIEKVINNTKFKQAIVLFSDRDVGGFTWGWADNIENINDEKLGLNTDNYNELCENLTINGLKVDNPFYYQSETGTTYKNRNKGLGRDLIYLNQDLLIENRDKVSQIIQRTSKGSPMYKIRKKQGYKEVYDYKDDDKRVIFAKINN
ncbi:MAG: hypothetical protein PHN31_04900 [Candidatus Gracilibacteria bacterium]|nr:hypothetical protein [Candidatus Gracilibacteria bacterium]